MKAWMIQIVTDIWGDVPYSEAHKGAEIPSPAYDTQADIYAGLLSELTAAQSQINVGGLGVSGDQVYGGDMALWKMCANSLKMRVAMRMSGVNSGTALTAIQEALSAGVFESNADNAQLVYATGEDGGNPLWVNRYIANRQDFSISEPFVNMLLARNDPRIDFFSDTPANDPGNHKGFPYGLSNTNATPLSIYDHSMMSDQNVMHVSAPGMIMNYAEVLFIKAEAVQALGLSGQGTAQEAYEAAVTASCEMWGASADAAATYLTETGVAWTAGSEPQLIGEQKYIALYMQGLQGWSEWRRTGWPVLEGPVDGSLIDMTGTIIPTRRTYPDQEELLNGANYDAAVARQGADLMDTKLWWDVD
jgi:hypothetical protein